MKILVFGVDRHGEKNFHTANKYKFKLSFLPERLTEKNVSMCSGYNALIITSIDIITEKNIRVLVNQYNIKIIVTRSIGTDNIDIDMFKKYGVSSASSSGYSPSSVAEFALSFVMNINTHMSRSSYEMTKGNYKIRAGCMRKEIRSSTVGIIGLGTIGLTTAKLFKNIGAKMLGYGNYQSDKAKKIVEFKDWNSILSQSDIIIVTTSYKPGINENLFNKQAFDKMKKNSIFINVARGQLHNEEDLYNALKSNKLIGAGVDVFANEQAFLFQNGHPSRIQSKLISLFPKFIYTPHIAYFTTDAIQDMATFSLDNIDKIINGKPNKRKLC